MNIDKIILKKVLLYNIMSELFCINFTYKSPHEDTESVMGFNPDGSVNIKYTLMALRDMLVHNVNIMNKLIEKYDVITDIIPIGYGVVGISTNYPSVVQTLVDNNILTKNPDDLEDEETIMNELNFLDDEETNQDRLNFINNLTNQNDATDATDIFGNNDNNKSGSDSGSESDDIIRDDKNTKSILNKYIDIINENNSVEDESENNDSDYQSDVANEQEEIY
jgi:hypothetical protein